MQFLHASIGMIPRRVARGVLGLLVFVVLVACGGDDSGDSAAPETTTANAETTSNGSQDASVQPALDERVPVGKDAHELAIRCWGDGSPAIVFEAGHPAAGITDYEVSLDFQSVVHSLAEEVTVCVYDRAGEGLSVPIPNRRRTVDDVVNDLHELLNKVGVPDPFLLVGASFGGLIIVHYAGRYPSEVAGLVLLDVPGPNPAAAEEAPEAHWDHPGNPEHVDAVATEQQLTDPLPIRPIPVRIVTAALGQSSPKDQAYWKKLSPTASQVTLEGPHDILDDEPANVRKQILRTLQASRKSG